jgi:hypothetical protein
MQNAAKTQADYLARTRLAEEVPGVPENERWFLWHGRKVEQHFSTLDEGKAYCAEHGITVDEIEYFRP